MAGPRNNFSYLAEDIRFYIMTMLHDGAEYDEVRDDTKVKKACHERNIKLHNTTFLAVKKSKEYKALCNQRLDMQNSLFADKLTSQLLKEQNVNDVISEKIRIDLLKMIQDLYSCGCEDSKDLERLVRSVVQLSNSAKDEKILELKKVINSKDNEISSLKLDIATLNNRIFELEHNNDSKNKGINEDTLKVIEEKIKIM